MEWFELWFGTTYYQQLYNNRSTAEAEDFIHTLTDFLKPKAGSRILDLACGQGRHARTLAQLGYDVTGIDLSAASIAEAKKFEQDNLHFFIGDMRETSFVNYFHYTFNLFTSFGYFQDDRDHAKAARAMSDGLKPGGFLVLDYINTAPALAKMKSHERIERGALIYDISKTFEEGHFIKNISLVDEQGAKHKFQERVKAFSLEELQTLLQQFGFKNGQVFGSYQLGAYAPEESPRMILIMSK